MKFGYLDRHATFVGRGFFNEGAPVELTMKRTSVNPFNNPDYLVQKHNKNHPGVNPKARMDIVNWEKDTLEFYGDYTKEQIVENSHLYLWLNVNDLNDVYDSPSVNSANKRVLLNLEEE